MLCHHFSVRNFMYGAPLDEATRDYKNQIQKQCVEFIWYTASDKAFQAGQKKVTPLYVKAAIAQLLLYKQDDDGHWQVKVGTHTLQIDFHDY
ncbi:MAG: hypothetical protein GKR87_12795 [Kiritimatiellae bacterium]|nr:hypothetical protein [Kiritimatiellia bacterium]